MQHMLPTMIVLQRYYLLLTSTLHASSRVWLCCSEMNETIRSHALILFPPPSRHHDARASTANQKEVT